MGQNVVNCVHKEMYEFFVFKLNHRSASSWRAMRSGLPQFLQKTFSLSKFFLTFYTFISFSHLHFYHQGQKNKPTFFNLASHANTETHTKPVISPCQLLNKLFAAVTVQSTFLIPFHCQQNGTKAPSFLLLWTYFIFMSAGRTCTSNELYLIIMTIAQHSAL